MQFGLPNAPTDNLYKFAAIFGLMLAATLFLYSDYMEQEAREQLLSFSKVFTERFYELVEGYAKNKSPIEMKILQEKYGDLDYSDGLKLMVASNRYDYYRKLRNLGVPILLLISVVGFIFWYIKVQRYQDMLLKHQAQAHGNQLN